MAKKGVPQKNGEGKGKGQTGRGGCKNPNGGRKGRNK